MSNINYLLKLFIYIPSINYCHDIKNERKRKKSLKKRKIERKRKKKKQTLSKNEMRIKAEDEEERTRRSPLAAGKEGTSFHIVDNISMNTCKPLRMISLWKTVTQHYSWGTLSLEGRKGQELHLRGRILQATREGEIRKGGEGSG